MPVRVQKDKGKRIRDMNIIILEKAQEMLQRKLGTGEFLRVTVTEGGCAGLTYSAEVGREMNEGDSVVLEQGNIRVVSDSNSSKYMDGLEINYSDDLFKGGLKFRNANTTSTCGCGSSFSLKSFPDIPAGKCSTED